MKISKAKTKEDSIPGLPAHVQQSLEEFNKKYGKNTFYVSSRTELIRRISSGCFAFDFITGGGFPERRLTELNGMESSFKSTLALSGMAQFFKAYPTALGLYIDLEQTFEKVHAERLGVDTKRCIVCDPDHGEQAADAIKDFLQLNVPIFAVLDSLAALRPDKEHQADTSDQLKIMGLQAKLAAYALSGVNSRLKRTKCDKDAPPIVFVVLNQMREKIGLVFGDPSYTPGGKAKDFYYSMTVRLRRASKSIKETSTVNGITKERTVGQEVSMNCLKNKAGGPQRMEGSFMFNFDTYEYNNPEMLIEYGQYFDLIRRTPLKKGFQLSYGSLETPEKQFRDALANDSDTQDELYNAILDELDRNAK